VEGRDDLLASDLVVTEIVSALSRRLRQGVITDAMVHRVQQGILKRLDEGVYRRVELTGETHRRAEALFVRLNHIPLRAADALHVAMAVSARAAAMASFDVRQRAAARAVGLSIYPPEEP